MASAMKKVNKITQIVRLKHLVQRWRTKTINRRSIRSYSSSCSSSDRDEPTASGGSYRRTPPGTLAVYVGPELLRFVIPTRFLNLPVFLSLLNKAEEEFGYQSSGGLVLPCEVGFFKGVLKLLERDEHRFGGFGLEEFVKVVSETGLDSFEHSCKESASSRHGFTPLLQKTRA